jgi:hypothetical protein
MKKIDFRQSWSSVGSGKPEIGNTIAQFEIYAGDCNLTRNENIFSQSIQDHVIVSTYPLGLWMLQNWWRLLYEPLPAHHKPDVSWRMAHELGAANYGFVWPKVIFASDGLTIQVWSSPSNINYEQSVTYINGLEFPISVPIPEFRKTLIEFISTVENRLYAVGLQSTDLSALFNIVKEEEENEDSRIYRKLEALMGFDPDECSPETMDYAVNLYGKYGEGTLLELAPVYGKGGQEKPLEPIEDFVNAPGVFGEPSISTRTKEHKVYSATPWKLAVDDARELRSEIGNTLDPIDTKKLFDLLGIASSAEDKWMPMGRSSVSVGIPINNKSIKFVPRKKHPISKRFELSRYVGDFIHTGRNKWLTNTDLGTFRQKYQRAFAAEFLCPINGLITFLEDDFSEEAIEDAADHFNVSEQTVSSLLANNHYIEYQSINKPPYHIGFNMPAKQG